MADELRLLNMSSHILHRYPAFESCNIDAIPLMQRLRIEPGQDVPVGMAFRFCRRCFKGGD